MGDVSSRRLASRRQKQSKHKSRKFSNAPLLAAKIRIVRHLDGSIHALGASRTELASKALKWGHCTGHTLAISEAPFSTHFNLENCLTQTPMILEGVVHQVLRYRNELRRTGKFDDLYPMVAAPYISFQSRCKRVAKSSALATST
jgi:hypothetical protein